MAVNLFAGIERMHGALDYHLERHNLLLTNVAHVDTPGYVPKDMTRAEGASFASALETNLRRTDPRHLSGSSTTVASGRVFEDPSAGAGNDKNFVSLDREAAKIASNQIRYDIISAITAAQLDGLQSAATDFRTG